MGLPQTGEQPFNFDVIARNEAMGDLENNNGREWEIQRMRGSNPTPLNAEKEHTQGVRFL